MARNGGVLGIIGCYGLSDQIIHLIERDESIGDLFVVDNAEGLCFVNKMKERPSGKNLVLVDEDELPRPEGREFTILLWLNPADLHNESSAIQFRQEEVLTKISAHVDSVFFCYGLCRSPEKRIIDLTERAPVPVTYLTDLRGEVVDDCFAAILGGKEAYLDHFRKRKGTLIATTGYVEAWKMKHERMDIESIVLEVEGLRNMFKDLEYHRVLKLDDGVCDPDLFEKDVRAFSRTFDLEMVSEKCHLTVLEHSYDLAKEKMGKIKSSGLEEVPVEQTDYCDAAL